MELLLHVLEHAFEDTWPLVPFLLVTYLVLEALEHAAGERVDAAVRRAGAAGPVVGALLGIVPQCGFSAMGATLYAGRVVTLGTLVAVFLSTSDEMLPLLVAERADAAPLAQILIAKAALAAATGLAIDLVLRALSRNARAHAALRRLARGVAPSEPSTAPGAPSRDLIDELAEAGEGAEHIHRLCERDRCGCGAGHGGASAPDAARGCGGHPHGHGHENGNWHEHGHGGHGCCGHEHGHGGTGSAVRSIVLSALSHTVQVTVFIFLVTCVLVALLETVGEPALSAFLSGNRALAVFAAALVGLVPNCAASVVITQLYLEGVLGFGALMAGSLVSAGVGYLVLFRTNRNARENAIVLVLIYAVGVFWGLVLSGFGM